ncbi:MAG: flagellar protein FlaG [Gammaproteobacteria bacterium]|nr:flagellar protein FlaG [Gammaproteobacteria bacterium]MBU1731952.1 flagellar protein FlaG [Gammaproteobacteria bacterium]MBU1893090.1 flagellar protein FlaG [Gammaproteobacteria bacterium]
MAKVSAATIEMPAKAVEAVKETTNPSSLKQATEKLNQAMKMMASNLQFTVDEDTGMDVVKVVDTDTKEVIRQFPSEEVIAIARAFDQLQGLLVRDKA